MLSSSSRTALLAMLACLGFAATAIAADDATTPAPAATDTAAQATSTSLLPEMHALVERINQKLRAGQTDEAALTNELQEFDALIAQHPGAPDEEVAQVYFLKAMLYVQVLENNDAGEALLKKIVSDYPHTEVASSASELIAQLASEREAANTVAALIGKPAPALHFEWASREGLTSLADLHGKVVVLDFWATWCGPCIRSFPAMRELVEHYAGKNVEVIGVTSLQGEVHNLAAQPIDCTGDPAKEHGLMPEFMTKKNMTWTVAFSREEVFNPEWGVHGIPYLAIVAPDGTVRHAGLHPSMPLDEKVAMIDALLAEFSGQSTTGS